MKGKERKYQKGITLIALVITIVVLLILAGVTLSIIFNEGIINKSQTSVDTYSEQSAREKLQLELVHMSMEKITNKNYNSGDFLTNELNKNEGFKINNNDSKIIVDGFEFTIDRDELIIIDENTVTASINYEVQSYNGINEEGKDTANVIVSIISNSNVKEIIFISPNKESFKVSVEELSNEIELEINKNYEVNIEMENGKVITKELNVDIGNVYDINFLESDGEFETTIGESLRVEGEGLTGKSYEVVLGDVWTICQLEKNVSFDLSKKFEISLNKKLETTTNAQMGEFRIILQQQTTNENYEDILSFTSSDAWESNQNISNCVSYNNSYILSSLFDKSEEWAIIGDGENIKIYCNGSCIQIVEQLDGFRVDKIVIQITKYPNHSVPSKYYLRELYLGPIKH